MTGRQLAKRIAQVGILVWSVVAVGEAAEPFESRPRQVIAGATIFAGAIFMRWALSEDTPDDCPA